MDNADPKKLGRLKVSVPSVLGAAEVTGWATPCVPYGGDANQGFLFIPEIDAGVWVEFEEGDLEFPIWSGTFWCEPGGGSELPTPTKADGTEDTRQDPPTRKIIKTRKGHTIQLEDADGDERIVISDGEGENRIVFSTEGITLQNKQNSIIMNADGIVIEDQKGNKMTQDANGLLLEDANNNKITLDAVSGGLPMTPGIAINGSKKVVMEGLLTWLMSHTHIGNMGAPCPLNPADLAKLAPLAAAPDGDILSQKVTIG